MTQVANENIAVVILAAGASSRLGSPKQLLSYGDKSMLVHAADHAIGTGYKPVVVVVGAEKDLMKNELQKMPVIITENNNWQQGMASSIICGLEKTLETAPDTEGVIFMVCDQPNLSSSLLISLVEIHKKTGKPIVASHYENKKGTPAFFHKSYFPLLQKLSGDSGAGQLIKEHAEHVAVLEFPGGGTDIDTMEDFHAWYNENIK